ncbi:MAG: hypothetical protein HPY66_2039 [Firmicutes bacterium]|nr:hypothetical protein [Bacillota bacterium]
MFSFNGFRRSKHTETVVRIERLMDKGLQAICKVAGFG